MKLTIRTKLLLLSLVILSIPYVGFEYLREFERYMRDALETSLVDAAKASAGPLQERDDLFQLHTDNPGETLFVHELSHPIQIDGYSRDWEAYIAWADRYQNIKQAHTDNVFAYNLIVGRFQQTLSVLLEVSDDNIVYQKPEHPDSIDNDHVMLVMQDHNNRLQHYYFSPTAAGKIRPFQIHTSSDEFLIEQQHITYATNISGEWQPGAYGYNLEIAIPLSLAASRLGFVVVDKDGDKLEKLGTGGSDTASSPGRLLQSSRQIRKIVTDRTQVDGRRVWILNNHGQVMASSGTLDKTLTIANQNIFYTWILPAVSNRVSDDLAGKSRLQSEEVKQALAGNTQTRWRSAADDQTVIVSAATPVWVEDEVRGVVVVEESSTGIQMLRRNAMASLFNKTLIVFFSVTVLLLLFATRLSSRIKRLSTQANAAIDEHGRVVGDFQVDKNKDEIGELSQNYDLMLGRLRQYNHYLENMAARLSHELRTPIAVVQSSLEQLQTNGEDEYGHQYVDRAKQGIDRLSLILTRLSEATRLEQAMQSTQKESTEINELLMNCCEGYRLAYPGQSFVLSIDSEVLKSRIAPDLFVQMLDKIVANAIDFSTSGKTIELKLARDHDKCQISVTNYGALLPPDMEEQLFNSMISMRKDSNKGDPHLGLGLYIVRLIAEYFDGVVTAENLKDAYGVCIKVILPTRYLEEKQSLKKT
jgi:two-component system sensor histidine kinase ChvG